MYLIRTILASAALVTSTVAQAIAFVDWPHVAVAGNSYNIRWSGGDGSPVTIKLLEGETSNLQTVATLTTTGTDHLFTWTISPTVPNGPNFALSIEDSYPNDLNYIGPIQLLGGSGSLIYTSVSVLNASSAPIPVVASAAPVYNVTSTLCPTAVSAAPTAPTAPVATTGTKPTPSIYPPITNAADKLAYPISALSVGMLLFLHFL